MNVVDMEIERLNNTRSLDPSPEAKKQDSMDRSQIASTIQSYVGDRNATMEKWKSKIAVAEYKGNNKEKPMRQVASSTPPKSAKTPKAPKKKTDQQLVKEAMAIDMSNATHVKPKRGPGYKSGYTGSSGGMKAHNPNMTLVSGGMTRGIGGNKAKASRTKDMSPKKEGIVIRSGSSVSVMLDRAGMFSDSMSDFEYTETKQREAENKAKRKRTGR